MLLTTIEDLVLALACLVKLRNGAPNLQEYARYCKKVEKIQQKICMHMAAQMDLDGVDLKALLNDIER